MEGKLPDCFRNADAYAIIQHILFQWITVFVSREDLISHLGTQFPTYVSHAIGNIRFSTSVYIPSPVSLGIF
jgi:hypothetical protein